MIFEIFTLVSVCGTVEALAMFGILKICTNGQLSVVVIVVQPDNLWLLGLLLNWL